MRQITAAEVKPGMEVQIITRMKIRTSTPWVNSHRDMRDDAGHVVRVDADTPVTVLSEPAPAQPEEPTEFGAKVAVDGCPAVRVNTRSSETGIWALEPWGQEPLLKTWAALLEMGDVVVPDQGWTVPAATPEVPERIEEWDTWEDVPEGVVVTVPGLFCHYRKNQGAIEFSDPDDDPDWTEPGVRAMPREYGPWTRVTDA